MVSEQVWLDGFAARLLQLKPEMSPIEAERIASVQIKSAAPESQSRSRALCKQISGKRMRVRPMSWMFPKTDWLMRFVARLLELLTPAAAVMVTIEAFDKSSAVDPAKAAEIYVDGTTAKE